MTRTNLCLPVAQQVAQSAVENLRCEHVACFSDIDKTYDIFTFCETVHRNQNLEPLPKMARREPKMTTLSQFFTRKVTVKLAK